MHDGCRSEKGQSLVGTLVAVGVLGIVILAMTSVFTVQHREMQSLNERLAILDTNRILSDLMRSSAVCTFMVNNLGPWLPSGTTLPLHFDTANVNSSVSPNIHLQEILSFPLATSPALVTVGQPAAPSTPSSIVESIEITDITGDPTGDQFLAVLRVNFKAAAMVRQLRPIDLKIPLSTSTSGSTKNILSCDMPSAASSGQSMVVQHLTPAGVPGDGLTTVWTKKTLNSLQFNNISGASLNNSVITLPAGSYHMQASLSLRGDNYEEIRSRLYNTTTATTICFGSSVRYPGSDEDTNFSIISCGFTLNAPTTLQIDIVSLKGNGVAGYAKWVGPAGAMEVHANVLVRSL